jgi:hypothetical protein
MTIIYNIDKTAPAALGHHDPFLRLFVLGNGVPKLHQSRGQRSRVDTRAGKEKAAHQEKTTLFNSESFSAEGFASRA